jgi:hypothetical protein
MAVIQIRPIGSHGFDPDFGSGEDPGFEKGGGTEAQRLLLNNGGKPSGNLRRVTETGENRPQHKKHPSEHEGAANMREQRT